MTVRTRIAPSPTGTPHLGTAYIALFNKAFAEQQQGQFILRIEDSDAARSTKKSEIDICESLQWLNLRWDEGPDVGGPRGPYRVSERLPIYREHAQQLLHNGCAFRCFCSPERLVEVRQAQQKRKETPKYDGHCLGLSPQESKRRADAGEPFVVRLRVPPDGECTFTDQIRGEITIPWQQVDMQVLVKSDGFPTYHLCATVDDHLMGITHILRGEEWLSSCPKHVLLYDYFGWDFQKLYHLPLLRNKDQSKMSKRKNPTGIHYYRDRGYIPEALLNYLGTMGWSMPDGREQFSYDEFVEKLDLKRITPRGPVFDSEKLDWLNGVYLRDLDDADFQNRYLAWAQRADLGKLSSMLKERAERFDQVLPQVAYLVGEPAPFDADSFVHKSLVNEDIVKILDFAERTLDTVADWQSEAIAAALRSTAEKCSFKPREFLAPLFVAISGKKVALPLFDSIETLGEELTRARLRTAIDFLGGISNKSRKKLDKEWEALFSSDA
ncbi:MAG: glutamate--tRNA ligase [Gammaproteobacteria bacterium]|nr:glutamate--tRNA ligase [Gammaproteobacteria bacterium]